jgi:hypothetical protein
MVQPKSQLDLARLQFMQHGPITILPSELEAIQTSFSPQIAPLIQLREVSESVMRNNTGTYRPHDESIANNADRKTARQVVEEVSKEARYEKAAIAHRYNQLDLLYREMFRRIINPDYYTSENERPGQDQVKSFIDRCKKRGVPADFLRKAGETLRIYATRAVGLGSLGVKYDLTNQVLNARPLLDAVGQVNALRDWLAARVGYRNVDRYKLAVNRDMVPSNEMSHAVLENNDLMEGSSVQVGSDQLHKVHLNTHAQGVIVPIIQAVESGQVQDPMKLLQALNVALQHAQGHLQLLAADPAQKEYTDQIIQLLQQGGSTLRMLQQAVQQMQEQARRQQQEQAKVVGQAQQVLQDRELEAKIYEINRKYQVEQMKQESLNAMRKSKTDEQMDIARDKAAAHTQLQSEMANAEMRMKEAKLSAELAQKARE